MNWQPTLNIYLIVVLLCERQLRIHILDKTENKCMKCTVLLYVGPYVIMRTDAAFGYKVININNCSIEMKPVGQN